MLNGIIWMLHRMFVFFLVSLDARWSFCKITEFDGEKRWEIKKEIASIFLSQSWWMNDTRGTRRTAEDELKEKTSRCPQPSHWHFFPAILCFSGTRPSRVVPSSPHQRNSRKSSPEASTARTRRSGTSFVESVRHVWPRIHSGFVWGLLGTETHLSFSAVSCERT